MLAKTISLVLGLVLGGLSSTAEAGRKCLLFGRAIAIAAPSCCRPYAKALVLVWIAAISLRMLAAREGNMCGGTMRALVFLGECLWRDR